MRVCLGFGWVALGAGRRAFPDPGTGRVRRAGALSGAALLLLWLAALPPFLSGQERGDCEIPRHEGWESFTTSTGYRIIHYRFPTITCGGGVRITADSAVVYEQTHFTQLFRNVEFREGETHLTAWQAHYFTEERLLRAWGSPVLTREDEGSVIRGDTMELHRAGPGRPGDQLTVTGRRPSATLYPAYRPSADDSTSRPPADTLDVSPDSAVALPDSALSPPPAEPAPRTPYEIEARRIFLEGDGYFLATGAVTIRRDSLNARADSVEYEEGLGALLLDGEAWVKTSSTELTARSIQLEIPQDEIREALAREEAVLVGENLRLLAPVIRLYFAEGALQRLVAVGDPALDSLSEDELLQRPPHPQAQALGLGRFPLRPYAVAEEYLLTADSIEVALPGDILEELWAVGEARGESMARDSLFTAAAPALFQRDWMEGDTIIAAFAPVPDSLPVSEEEAAPPPPVRRPDPDSTRVPPDRDPLTEGAGGSGGDSSDSSYRLERLMARGSAKSFYRMEATDSAAVAEGKPALHYVVGEEITIFMVEGEVDRMEVKGKTEGIHLEPVPEGQRGGGGQLPASVSPDGSGVPRDRAALRPRVGGGEP